MKATSRSPTIIIIRKASERRLNSPEPLLIDPPLPVPVTLSSGRARSVGE